MAVLAVHNGFAAVSAGISKRAIRRPWVVVFLYVVGALAMLAMYGQREQVVVARDLYMTAFVYDADSSSLNSGRFRIQYGWQNLIGSAKYIQSCRRFLRIWPQPSGM